MRKQEKGLSGIRANNIAVKRLISQQIAGTKLKTAKDVVGWMGAMQAQDYEMAKWAVGVRLPDSTNQMIESAVSNALIEKIFSGRNNATREEITAEFERAKIATDKNRAYHLILQAELDGLICSGVVTQGKQTYALLKERVPIANVLV